MVRAHTLLETVVSDHQMTEVFSGLLKPELNLSSKHQVRWMHKELGCCFGHRPGRESSVSTTGCDGAQVRDVTS